MYKQNHHTTKKFAVKAIFLFYLFTLLPLTTSAQSFRFAYLSYDKVLQSMTEYSIAMANIKSLREQYDAEIKRTEEDFNNKYEEFLEVQNTLAPSIRDKRQVELQDMMNRGIAFKAEAERLLRQAEEDAIAPVRKKLSDGLASYARSNGYAFVLNSDANQLPFVDNTYGVDITDEMISTLR